MHPHSTPQTPQKTCKQCGKTGGWEMFYLSHGRPIGRCKECHKHAQALHRQGIVPTSLRKSAPQGMWECSRCKELKPLTAFNSDKSKPRGHNYTCRECMRAYLRHRYTDPAFRRLLKSSNLRRLCGISMREYDALYEVQGGICAICGKPADASAKGVLYVDHCHVAGHARGLLCGNCNTGIGMFGDDPALLAKAIAYLAAHAAPLPA